MNRRITSKPFYIPTYTENSNPNTETNITSLHGAAAANNEIKLTARPEQQARTLVTQPLPVQTIFKNRRPRPNFDKIPVPAQITDRYTWKTGKQQVRRGDKSGRERIMETMNEHPHRQFNAWMTSHGHSTVNSIEPES